MMLAGFLAWFFSGAFFGIGLLVAVELEGRVPEPWIDFFARGCLAWAVLTAGCGIGLLALGVLR